MPAIDKTPEFGPGFEEMIPETLELTVEPPNTRVRSFSRRKNRPIPWHMTPSRDVTEVLASPILSSSPSPLVSQQTSKNRSSSLKTHSSCQSLPPHKPDLPSFPSSLLKQPSEASLEAYATITPPSTSQVENNEPSTLSLPELSSTGSFNGLSQFPSVCDENILSPDAFSPRTRSSASNDDLSGSLLPELEERVIFYKQDLLPSEQLVIDWIRSIYSFQEEVSDKYLLGQAATYSGSPMATLVQQLQQRAAWYSRGQMEQESISITAPGLCRLSGWSKWGHRVVICQASQFKSFTIDYCFLQGTRVASCVERMLLIPGKVEQFIFLLDLSSVYFVERTLIGLLNHFQLLFSGSIAAFLFINCDPATFCFISRYGSLHPSLIHKCHFTPKGSSILEELLHVETLEEQYGGKIANGTVSAEWVRSLPSYSCRVISPIGQTVQPSEFPAHELSDSEVNEKLDQILQMLPSTSMLHRLCWERRLFFDVSEAQLQVFEKEMLRNFKELASKKGLLFNTAPVSIFAGKVLDEHILRFLYTSNGDVPLAMDSLWKSAAWRSRRSPRNVEAFNRWSHTGAIYQYGKSIWGHPVVILRTKVLPQIPMEDLMDYIAQFLDMVILQLLSPGMIEQWFLIVDFGETEACGVSEPLRCILNLLEMHFPMFTARILWMNSRTIEFLGLVPNSLIAASRRVPDHGATTEWIKSAQLEARFGGNGANVTGFMTFRFDSSKESSATVKALERVMPKPQQHSLLHFLSPLFKLSKVADVRTPREHSNIAQKVSSLQSVSPLFSSVRYCAQPSVIKESSTAPIVYGQGELPVESGVSIRGHTLSNSGLTGLQQTTLTTRCNPLFPGASPTTSNTLQTSQSGGSSLDTSRYVDFEAAESIFSAVLASEDSLTSKQQTDIRGSVVSESQSRHKSESRKSDLFYRGSRHKGTFYRMIFGNPTSYKSFEKEALKRAQQFSKERSIHFDGTVFEDQSNVLRFLQAAEYNEEVYLKNALQHLVWRAGTLPVNSDEFKKASSPAVCYLFGQDRKKRPIFVCRMSRYKASEFEIVCRSIFCLLEHAIDCLMTSGVTEQITVIVDLQNVSVLSLNTYSAKSLIKILQQNYPGRLHRLYAVNTPASFRLLWNMFLWGSISKSTRDRVHLLGDNFADIVRKDLGRNQLERSLGGRVPDMYFRPGQFSPSVSAAGEGKT